MIAIDVSFSNKNRFPYYFTDLFNFSLWFRDSLTPFTPRPPIPPLQLERGPGGEAVAPTQLVLKFVIKHSCRKSNISWCGHAKGVIPRMKARSGCI
jgi:hypothetical protein